MKSISNNLLEPYVRQFSMKFAKGISQAYNLITCMPEMNSFMVFTRWSVYLATLLRNLEKTLPVQAAQKYISIALDTLYINKCTLKWD